MLDRLSSRPMRTWVPMLFGVLWIGAVGSCALWWARYFLGARWQLTEADPTVSAQSVAWLGVLSILASWPMAARATELLTAGDLARQTVQAKRAMALPIGVVAYLALTAVVSGGTMQEVRAAAMAHEGRRPATAAEQRMNDAEIDRLMTAPPTGGKTFKEIPWNGKGVDPNFPIK